MEDYRDKVVVICAGYEKEMQEFLKSNSGLQSRFPRLVNFKSYTTEEMLLLFENLCHENKYTPTSPAISKLSTILKKFSSEEIDKLGNARLIRNIFEKTIVAQSKRISTSQIEIENISIIEAEDIILPDQSDSKQHLGFI